MILDTGHKCVPHAYDPGLWQYERPYNYQETFLLAHVARMWASRDAANKQLTIVQTRCTELLEEVRFWKSLAEEFSSNVIDPKVF